MSLVWLVECKTCQQRFGVQRREASSGKSTDALDRGAAAGKRECPHCHDRHDYTTDDYIPGEGRVYPQ